MRVLVLRVAAIAGAAVEIRGVVVADDAGCVPIAGAGPHPASKRPGPRGRAQEP